MQRVERVKGQYELIRGGGPGAVPMQHSKLTAFMIPMIS